VKRPQNTSELVAEAEAYASVLPVFAVSNVLDDNPFEQMRDHNILIG